MTSVIAKELGVMEAYPNYYFEVTFYMKSGNSFKIPLANIKCAESGSVKELKWLTMDNSKPQILKLDASEVEAITYEVVKKISEDDPF